MSSIENQMTIEKNEVPKSRFIDRYNLPIWVNVPKDTEDRYMKLSEAARDSELHAQIEASLSDLGMRIQKKNQEISLSLATVIHG